MKYVSKETRDAFSCASENYHRPLVLLEKALREAGLDIRFEGRLILAPAPKERATTDFCEYKIVVIYRDGRLEKAVVIEGVSPAMAVADVARGVIPI